jgi:hypothetical protein
MKVDQIEAAKTSRGGWTRDTLAQWGVPWPPPKGWKAALTAQGTLLREDPRSGAEAVGQWPGRPQGDAPKPST